LDDILSFIEFFFAKIKYICKNLQNESDWSKHKKAPNIIVTSRITFLGYPKNIFANIFAFCFFTQNARNKWIEAAN